MRMISCTRTTISGVTSAKRIGTVIVKQCARSTGGRTTVSMPTRASTPTRKPRNGHRFSSISGSLPMKSLRKSDRPRAVPRMR